MYEFGVLSSLMHFVWMKYTGGRLESRFQYSSRIVYNNFPWPKTGSDEAQTPIVRAAQGVLDARRKYPGSSLSDLYDAVAMPPDLTRAHQTLDKAVEMAYLAGSGRKGFSSDADRVAFLFDLYQKYTSLLLGSESAKPRRKSKKNK